MAYEFISYQKKDRIAYVTIERPDRLNALHPPANAELHDAFSDFRDDPDVWIAIITGSGERAFSAGNDLKYTAEHGRRDLSATRTPFGGITSNFTCWKPIIAAVNGFALGGGFELALACDIIIAADHAEVGLPEPRVGLVAGAGGVHRLPRHIPMIRPHSRGAGGSPPRRTSRWPGSSRVRSSGLGTPRSSSSCSWR